MSIASEVGAPPVAERRAPSPVYILRDKDHLFEHIRQGQGLHALIRQSSLTAVAGAALLGVSLGTYAGTFSQILASSLKLPILLLGAALICFPAFHLLQSALARYPQSLRASVALQSIALASVALVWGSLSPAVLFLVTSTQHYRLCQFLAVGVGAAGGLVGLSTLSAGYRYLCHGPENEGDEQGRRRRLRSSERPLVAYLFLFSCVGGQLAWMLRPFIGSPTMPFQLFRAPDPETGNFFVMLLRMFGLWS